MQKSYFSTLVYGVLINLGSLLGMIELHQDTPKTSYMNILGQNPGFQQGLPIFFDGGSVGGRDDQLQQVLQIPRGQAPARLDQRSGLRLTQNGIAQVVEFLLQQGVGHGVFQ